MLNKLQLAQLSYLLDQRIPVAPPIRESLCTRSHYATQEEAVLGDTLISPASDWLEPTERGGMSVNHNGWQLVGSSQENALVPSRNTPLSVGNLSNVWQCKSDGGKGLDGGYRSPSVPIDKSKLYRFATYMMKLDSKEGRTYHGLYSYDKTGGHSYLTKRKSGKTSKSPSFWSGDLTKLNQWYLLVGYVYPVGTPQTSYVEGGIWEVGVDGRRRKANSDFVWGEDSAQACVKDHFALSAVDNTNQLMFRPRLECINGMEMPLELLINARK